MAKNFQELKSTDIITRTELTVDGSGDSLDFFELESNGGMGRTSRVEEVSKAIKKILRENVNSDTGEQRILESQGLECEVFMADGEKGWRKGKVRVKINLEFCPDEEIQNPPLDAKKTKSILDDLR